MTKEEAIASGKPYACLGCHSVYAVIPTEEYEDGHGGRLIDMCHRCGCDLFIDLRTGKPPTGH